MKPLLILFIGLFLTNLCLAQEPERLKKYESQTANRSFYKGDTLLIGDPGKNAFSAQKKYFGLFVKSKKNVCGFVELDSVIKGEFLVIKNILKYTDHCSIDFQNAVVFELMGASGKLIYMAIEKALQHKELILFPNQVKKGRYKELDDQAVFLLTLNSTDASADYAFKYCRLVDFEKSKVYDNNPSLFEKDKNDWVQRLNADRKAMKVKDTFWLMIPVYLGAYSHDKNEFKLVDVPGAYGSKPIPLNLDTKLTFDNYAAFSTLKSTKAQSDLFQNTTTPDYNGNRKAYLQVKAVCNSMLKEPSAGPTGLQHTMRFTILELHAVDSEHLEYNYIGTKKK